LKINKKIDVHNNELDVFSKLYAHNIKGCPRLVDWGYINVNNNN